MIRRPPRSTQSRSSAASDVYKRQDLEELAAVGARESNGDELDGGVDRGGHADVAGVQPKRGDRLVEVRCRVLAQELRALEADLLERGAVERAGEQCLQGLVLIGERDARDGATRGRLRARGRGRAGLGRGGRLD